MSPKRLRQVEELYHSAGEQAPEQRGAFLAEACGGDEELRREVESLLAQSGSGDFMERPALEVAGGLLAEETVTRLARGALLGPYQIEMLLGAGGMGQVYKARDTRLGRAVAIKITRQQFSRRFEREARAISKLNHPNICTVHDVGPNYLVMELVEGDTLATLLRKGALPIELVLRYGVQIADALAAAHAQGITHRDLKPANIMVTKSGIKILDFGLAKVAASPNAPETQTLTAAREIIGTPAYMAPEQLEGKATDSRTDIYALGVVLYEMATGKCALPGHTPLKGDLPAQLPHIIERCLAQDPDERWQSARDVRAELQWTTLETRQAPGSRKASISWRWVVVAGILISVVGAAVQFIPGSAREPSPSAQPFSFRIPIPEGLRMLGRSTFSISPDGRSLAFLAARSDGVEHVWVQRIGELEAKLLPNTESTPDSPSPFWSPDSRTIGFYSDGRLKKINLNGGAPQTICEVSSFASGGSWSRDDMIIFGDLTRGVMRVPAAGGMPIPLTALDRGETFQTFPVFLPDARHFLYLRTGAPDDVEGIYVGSIDTEPGKQEPKRLLAVPQAAQIVALGDNRVEFLYLRGGTLMAQDFDTGKLQFRGEPAAVAEPVGNSLAFGFYAASPRTLAYRSPVAENIQLQWFDRQGKSGAAVGGPIARQASVALSPDGQRALVGRLELKTATIWLLDLHRDVFLRLTTSPTFDSNSIWSPDGQRFTFTSNRLGSWDLFQGMVDGDTRPVPLLRSSSQKFPRSWSANGRFLLYTTRGAATKEDLWVLPFDQGNAGTPFPFAATTASESEGMYSPNERWIAFTSDETGSNEVYVRSFAPPAYPGVGDARSPVTESKIRVSTAGGVAPHWRRDGKELFYVASDGRLMSVAVESGNSFQAETPQALFPIPSRVWDVAPDGKRFLVGVPVERSAQVPFTVVTNWIAGLKH